MPKTFIIERWHLSESDNMDPINLLTWLTALLFGFIAMLLGEWDTWIQLLFIVMFLDIFTGILKCIPHKSEKTKGGRFLSSVFISGLIKKGAIIAVVIVAVLVDTVMVESGFSYDILITGTLRNTIIMFFFIGECISILENAGRCGIPIPCVLSDFLEVLSRKNTREEVEKEEPAGPVFTFKKTKKRI